MQSRSPIAAERAFGDLTKAKTITRRLPVIRTYLFHLQPSCTKPDGLSAFSSRSCTSSPGASIRISNLNAPPLSPCTSYLIKFSRQWRQIDPWVWVRRAGPRVETVAFISGLGAAGGPRNTDGGRAGTAAQQKLREPAFTHTPGL